MIISIAWIIFAGVILAIVAFNATVVWYLAHTDIIRIAEERKDAWLPIIVTILGLSLCLFCMGLIPVDIYSVSSSDLSSDIREAVKILYYILYGSMLGFIFILIPFSYFYYEEYGEEVTFKRRVFAGCKYTIFLMLIVVVIFIIGLFVKGSASDISHEDYEKYVKEVIDSENSGEATMNFALACAGLIGLIAFLIYTAYGFASLPIGWMRGNKNIEDEQIKLEHDLAVTQEKRKVLRARHAAGQTSRSDESRLSLLRNQERKLTQQSKTLEASRGCAKCLSLFRPFMFVFGFVFFLISVVLIVSMVLTNVDKIVNSQCGLACGYTLSHPKKWNPLDAFLVLMSKYFPLDYVVVAVVVVYIYFATLSGISNIGIRFLWILLYRVKARATKPQGLLIATLIMMLSLLALNMQLMSLFPQYATYGSQTWGPDNAQCDITAPPDQCQMTQIGTIIHRIFMRLSFFGVVFYFSTWVFVAFFAVSIVIVLIRGRPSNLVDDDNDPDFDF
jgi:LMBR1 domain-containing protein 1